jgi:hypothetical protein
LRLSAAGRRLQQVKVKAMGPFSPSAFTILVSVLRVRGKHIRGRGLHVLFGKSEREDHHDNANIDLQCSPEKLSEAAQRPFFTSCMPDGGGYPNALSGEYRGCTTCWKGLGLRNKYRALGAEWDTNNTAKQATAPLAKNKRLRIPNIVHFIWVSGLFEWTAYLAIESAHQHLKPDQIFVHCLDGIEPDGPWFARVKRRVVVRAFKRADFPQTLNGSPLTNPAHVTDFVRLQLLSNEGGIYMDTDIITLKPFDRLREHSAVFGWQAPDGDSAEQGEGGEQEEGTPSVCNGLMMSASDNMLFGELYEASLEAYDGSWTAHSIGMLSKYLTTRQVSGPQV